MALGTVIVVGSGVAGAAVAEGLIARGVGKVLLFEAGPGLLMRDHATWLEYLASNVPPYRAQEDPSAPEDSVGPDAWDFRRGRLHIRGGTIHHWDGWCLRLQPEDFERRRRTGVGADWPFGYAELEPHYEWAEAFLQVAGAADDPGGPPRRAPYPLPAVKPTMTDRVLIDAFRTLGWSYGHMPIARNTRPVGGMSSCLTFGTCGYCPVGGRYTPDQTLDRLEGSGKLTVHLRAPVRSVIVSNGRATGVRVEEDGTLRDVSADRVVLCAGAIEVPKLLFASATPGVSSGLGNASGMLGRFLTSHPHLSLTCRQPDNPRKLQQELDFRTFMSRQFDQPEHQAEGKMFLLNSPRAPVVDLAALIADGKTRAEIEAAVVGEHSFQLEAFVEEVGQYESRVELADGINALGLTRTRVHFVAQPGIGKVAERCLGQMRAIAQAMGYTVTAAEADSARRAFHAMGTTRMAANPAAGVVDANLRVHGMEGLYVCSNAVFPSSGAVPPTLTLVALAHRLSEHLCA